MAREQTPFPVEPADDLRWIPMIDSYCDRRCPRCEFNQRCLAHVEERRLLAIVDNPALEAECPPTRSRPLPDRAAGIDPVVLAAMEYATDVWNILKLVEHQPLSSATADAIGDIAWCCTMIAAKVRRAFSAHEYLDDEDADPVQNDWNGSAKIARLMIEQSLKAWDVVCRTEGALDRALVSHLTFVLQQIDTGVAERCPRAMDFVRPGFDEAIPGLARPWKVFPEEEDGR